MLTGPTMECDEPLIVSYGREHITEYRVEEFEQALERAFVAHRADFVLLDDNIRGRKFVAASTAWAIDEGLLYCDRTEDDGQSVVSSFRMTDKGRKLWKR